MAKRMTLDLSRMQEMRQTIEQLREKERQLLNKVAKLEIQLAICQSHARKETKDDNRSKDKTE